MLNIDEIIISAEACIEQELLSHDDTTKRNLLLGSIAQSTLAIAKMLNEWRKSK